MITERLEHPGIIFPDSPLHPRHKSAPVTETKTKRPRLQRKVDMNIPTDWGITTAQIAKKLGISSSAVRQYMHRHKIPHKLIKNPLTGPSLLFWDKSKVLPLINSYPRTVNKLPKGFITGKEACLLLNASPTTLTRICSHNKVPSKLVKYSRNGSWRMHRVYARDSILEVLKAFKSSGFFASLN